MGYRYVGMYICMYMYMYIYKTMLLKFYFIYFLWKFSHIKNSTLNRIRLVSKFLKQFNWSALDIV